MRVRHRGREPIGRRQRHRVDGSVKSGAGEDRVTGAATHVLLIEQEFGEQIVGLAMQVAVRGADVGEHLRRLRIAEVARGVSAEQRERTRGGRARSRALRAGARPCISRAPPARRPSRRRCRRGGRSTSRATSVPTTSSNAIGLGMSWRMNLSSVCAASSITRRLAAIGLANVEAGLFESAGRAARDAAASRRPAALHRARSPAIRKAAHRFGQRLRRVEELQMMLGRSSGRSVRIGTRQDTGMLAGTDKLGREAKRPLSFKKSRPLYHLPAWRPQPLPSRSPRPRHRPWAGHGPHGHRSRPRLCRRPRGRTVARRLLYAVGYTLLRTWLRLFRRCVGVPTACEARRHRRALALPAVARPADRAARAHGDALRVDLQLRRDELQPRGRALDDRLEHGRARAAWSGCPSMPSPRSALSSSSATTSSIRTCATSAARSARAHSDGSGSSSTSAARSRLATQGRASRSCIR